MSAVLEEKQDTAPHVLFMPVMSGHEVVWVCVSGMKPHEYTWYQCCPLSWGIQTDTQPPLKPWPAGRKRQSRSYLGLSRKLVYSGSNEDWWHMEFCCQYNQWSSPLLTHNSLPSAWACDAVLKWVVRFVTVLLFLVPHTWGFSFLENKDLCVCIMFGHFLWAWRPMESDQVCWVRSEVIWILNDDSCRGTCMLPPVSYCHVLHACEPRPISELCWYTSFSVLWRGTVLNRCKQKKSDHVHDQLDHREWQLCLFKLVHPEIFLAGCWLVVPYVHMLMHMHQGLNMTFHYSRGVNVIFMHNKLPEVCFATPVS